jgi:hypothetical protein
LTVSISSMPSALVPYTPGGSRRIGGVLCAQMWRPSQTTVSLPAPARLMCVAKSKATVWLAMSASHSGDLRPTRQAGWSASSRCRAPRAVVCGWVVPSLHRSRAEMHRKRGDAGDSVSWVMNANDFYPSFSRDPVPLIAATRTRSFHGAKQEGRRIAQSRDASAFSEASRALNAQCCTSRTFSTA